MKCPVMLLRKCGLIIAALGLWIKGLVRRFVLYLGRYQAYGD
jgi:hypothetical protein